MIGIDTNVLLRFLVDDDQAQNDKARNFLSKCTSENPAYINAVTLAETVWVLRRSLGYSREQIVVVLRALLATPEAVLEHASQLSLIVQGGRNVKGDIADYLVSFANAQAGCAQTVTFDKQAADAVPGMTLLT